MKHFVLFLTLLFFPVALYAAPATVTNEGNIPARVQYKTADADYQDLNLNPGESRELPGGVEKVKLVREPGQWASPEKAGEEIKITVKEGDQITGTMGWYGEKVFFSNPTEPPVSPAEVQPEVAETPVPVETQTAETETPAPVKAVSTAESGTITNNGYLPMTITFQGPDGTMGSETVGMGGSIKIPQGATGMTIREPMIFSGYTFGKKAVDLEIVKPSGEATNVDQTPFEGLELDLGGTQYHFQYQWNLKVDFKITPKYTFGDQVGSEGWKKENKMSNQPAARDMQESERQSSIQFKF